MSCQTSKLASKLINYSGDSLQYKFICNSCKSVPPFNNNSDLKTTIQNLTKTVHDLPVLVSSLIDWRTSLDSDLSESVRKLSSSVSGLLEWRSSFGGVHSSFSVPLSSNPAPPTLFGDSRTIIREELVELREKDKSKYSIVVRGLEYESDFDFQNSFD